MNSSNDIEDTTKVETINTQNSTKVENPETLESIKDFLSNYTSYTLQYISEDTIFFGYDMVDFSICVVNLENTTKVETSNTQNSTLVENRGLFKFILSKREFDSSGDYIERLKTNSLNKILNSIDSLYLTNKL